MPALRIANGLGLVALMLAPAACNQQQAEQWNLSKPAFGAGADAGPVESNIVRVNKFFKESPWLCFNNDGGKRVDGVGFSVYLEGPNKPKGVFGTGTLVVNMYRLEFGPDGREVPVEVYKWEMPADQAYVWRAKQRTALGWGYGLRLHWDDKIDVVGKQVAFVVKYVREDGREISSSRQVFKVPANSLATAHSG